MFWDLFGFYDIPKGITLEDYRWEFIWRKLKRKRRLPTFRTNLLIQAKRPEVFKRVPKDLKKYGYKGLYWRFTITPHQQEILEKVSKKLNHKALVVYASPAFNTLDDLYDYTEAQEIVENTSFVKVERLISHTKWNYNAPGSAGVAHSEPEYIEDKNIFEMLSSYNEYENVNSDFPNNLSYLHKCAVEVCNETVEYNALARYYLKLHSKLLRAEQLFEREETIDYIAFSIFCDVMKIKWLIA